MINKFLHICVTESLCCTCENNTIFQIDYTTIKNFFNKKRRKKDRNSDYSKNRLRLVHMLLQSHREASKPSCSYASSQDAFWANESILKPTQSKTKPNPTNGDPKHITIVLPKE